MPCGTPSVALHMAVFLFDTECAVFCCSLFTSGFKYWSRTVPLSIVAAQATCSPACRTPGSASGNAGTWRALAVPETRKVRLKGNVEAADEDTRGGTRDFVSAREFIESGSRHVGGIQVDVQIVLRIAQKHANLLRPKSAIYHARQSGMAGTYPEALGSRRHIGAGASTLLGLGERDEQGHDVGVLEGFGGGDLGELFSIERRVGPAWPTAPRWATDILQRLFAGEAVVVAAQISD
ncbi:hypothetical protein BDP55DRAFT_638552 [Colletotrichum godetiae]|uniref:Uncharacterized protein n=1 Tax=Colletotrichum godetiae TaxID=1209918 RepID=A0AAJ0A9T5_9PEZI|nr:uncharacterized protein BDP55DRAFT_638552 [Colletotrichum godetiae]KAK1657652.1 hypothetical protein BDP55DRAFT_638552 [Colletotrichum godetiae]